MRYPQAAVEMGLVLLDAKLKTSWQCNAMQYNAIQRNTTKCNAMQSITELDLENMFFKNRIVKVSYACI